jgi:hypothetical protein
MSPRIFTALFACLALCCLVAAPARAYEKKPEPTKPLAIAMTYEKFLGKQVKPDFAEWVKETPEYNNAQLWERPDILEKNTQALEDTYNLMTGVEPIVVSIRTRISSYSRSRHGFLVGGFSNRDFFNFEYLGRRFALVPHGIEAYQWMKAPPGFADDVMHETDNGSDANLIITLTPISADPEPLVMKGHHYSLLMADVSKIELWSKDGSRVVWDDTMNAPHSTRSKLLNLWQP